MSALPKRFFTPAEYLALEVKAEHKSQYVAGEIYALAGAEPEHNKIVANVGGLLYVAFRGRNCDHFYSDMRLQIKAGELYTYPDLMALCGKPEFNASSRPKSLLNPQVVFEVLSPSTEGFDRGDKFARYRLLESLTDYVLVSSEQMRVEHYTRQPDNRWLLTALDQPGQVLKLPSLECELPLAEIYERVTFPEV